MSDPIEGVGEKRSIPEYQKHSPAGLEPEQQHKIDTALAFHKDILGFAKHHEGAVPISQFNLMVHHLVQIQDDSHMPTEIRDKVSGLISDLKTTASQQGGMVYVDVTVGDTVVRELEPLSSQ
jgi:hypothetical protein